MIEQSLNNLKLPASIMEIALLILLFLVGTVASAIQALKYLERRRPQGGKKPPPATDGDHSSHPDP